MVAITAVERPTPTPAATLTISGLTVGTDATITVRRAWAGNLAPVRNLTDAPVTGSTMQALDYECPFVPTSYQVTVKGANGGTRGNASSGQVSMPSINRPWISDPLNPRAATPIRLSADALTQLDYGRPGDVLQPLGSAEPVAIVGTRMAAGQVPMDILCQTGVAKVQALLVLQSADPVCVRFPAADRYSMVPPLCYMTAPTVSERPLTVQQGGEATRIVWTAQIVRAPTTPIAAPARTYADLLTEASTYADLTELYATYNALLIGG